MRQSRIARIAIVVFPIVAVVGCSSSSSTTSAKKVTSSTSATSAPSGSSSSSSSSTSAPTAGAGTPCTAAAASAVLAPDTATSIVCGGGWAAGSAHNADVDYAYLLHDVNGAWTDVETQANAAEMQQACANANPLGIPQNVLAVSPCKVS